MERNSDLKREIAREYERTDDEVPELETVCTYSEDHCPDCSVY